MPFDSPTHGDSANRRDLLRAGLVGAGGLALAPASVRAGDDKPAAAAAPPICPAWLMTVSFDPMNNVMIYTYVSYQYNDWCFPDFSTFSTRDSTSVLKCGCQGDCLVFTRLPIKLSTAIHVPHKHAEALDTTGMPRYCSDIASPMSDKHHHQVYKLKGTGIYVLLHAARYHWDTGRDSAGNVGGAASVYVGREVDPATVPAASPPVDYVKVSDYSATCLARVDLPNSPQTLVGFSTSTKTKLP